MPIPDPYFESVPGCGPLRMEQVLVDYDYPLLAVLRDNNGNRYLSLCFDTRGAQQWLIAPVSNQDLIALLKNEVPLVHPFTAAHALLIHAVLDYRTREERFEMLDAADVPPENLPERGEYLDANEDEWKEYIGRLDTSPRLDQ